MRHLLPGERPFPHRATSSHPQLRDLLHLLPPVDGQQRLLTTCHTSIRYATPAHEPMQRLLPLPYCPTALSTGNGIVVVGGHAGQLSLRMNSASGLDPMTTWTNAVEPLNGSIVNSIWVDRTPGSMDRSRLLVSSNDRQIKVYDIAIGEDERGGIGIVRVPSATVNLHTAVNYTSVSPTSRYLIAVGDTPEVHLYSMPSTPGGTYEWITTFDCANDGAFSSSWARSGSEFAVGSQDGEVNIFDIRNLPSSSSSAPSAVPRPHRIATLTSTCPGRPAGAVRKVMYSRPSSKLVTAGGSTPELLAFSEHEDVVQVFSVRDSYVAGEVLRLEPGGCKDEDEAHLSPVHEPSLSGHDVEWPVDLSNTLPPLHLSLAGRRVRSVYDIPRISPPSSGDEDCPEDFPPPLPPSLAALSSYATSSYYHSSSRYFPPDDTASERSIFGLDWDEGGEKLWVGMRDSVRCWQVDKLRARVTERWGFA